MDIDMDNVDHDERGADDDHQRAKYPRGNDKTDNEVGQPNIAQQYRQLTDWQQ